MALKPFENEEEWQSAADSWRMLNFVDEIGSRRKAELVTIACCRQHRRGKYKTNLVALAAVERHADGLISDAELNVIRYRERGWLGYSVSSAASISNFSPCIAAQIVFGLEKAGRDLRAAKKNADVIREVFGNPFRPHSYHVESLSYSVHALANDIYDKAAFGRMPALAALLAESGIENRDLIEHCRQTKGHVRGCWALDAVLGKH